MYIRLKGGKGIPMKFISIKKVSLLSLILIGLLCVSFTFSKVNVKVLVYPYFRAIQNQWILYKTKDYKNVETKHFIIKYNSQDSDIVELVAEAAEKNYIQLCKSFDYYPAKKVTVIIYNDAQQLMKNANLGSGKPPMGVYLASTIQILSPKLWIPEEEDMRELFLNEGPMVHELAHLLVDDLAKNNYPIWFTEGIALYQEYIQTGYEWGKYLQYPEQPYTIEQLTKEFYNLDEMLAYKRSFEVIRNIAKERGFESLNQLIRILGEGKNFSKTSNQLLDIAIE